MVPSGEEKKIMRYETADNWDVAELEEFLRALSITYNGFYMFTMGERLREERFREFIVSLKDFAAVYSELERGYHGGFLEWPHFGYLDKYYVVPSMSDLILTLNASLREEEKLKLSSIQIGSPGFIEIGGLPVPLEALLGLVPLIISRFFPNKHKKTMQNIEEDIKKQELISHCLENLRKYREEMESFARPTTIDKAMEAICKEVRTLIKFQLLEKVKPPE
jgi:hypothetical protein